jgi:hypothetical protein
MVVWKILMPLYFCCIAKYSRSCTGTTIIKNTGEEEEEEEEKKKMKRRRRSKMRRGAMKKVTMFHIF